jgi:hypothetical protein
MDLQIFVPQDQQEVENVEALAAYLDSIYYGN